MKAEDDAYSLDAVGSRFVVDDGSETSSPSDDSDLDAPARRKRSRQAHSGTDLIATSSKSVKLEWSDTDDEPVISNKAGRKSTRQPATSASTKAKTSKSSGGTGVGQVVQTRPRKQTRRRRNILSNTGDKSDDEEELDPMPPHLRARRRRFDERAERLKEAGLALPPTYDDVYFSDSARMRTLKERPVLPKVTPPSAYKDIEMPYSLGVIPAPIAQYLKEYQVQGAAFLHELFVYQKGGILGDDMGLGKTIQVIAFLTAMYGKTGDERDGKRMRKMRNKGHPYFTTLIICPGSLMANWEDELNRWGWWQIEVYHGNGSHKDSVLAAAKSGRLEIMITTYHTYRMQQDRINSVRWDCVVADECHIIKEHDAEITKSMMVVNALCRIGLTGTAVQNNYEELWTLLNWTNPGRLGKRADWKCQVSQPLKLGQSHYATGQELAMARKTAQLLVHNLLPQLFLRRMKTLIRHQLPKKTDKVVFCPLTEEQQNAYRAFLSSEYIQIIKTRTELCCEKKGGWKKRGWCCYTHLSNGDKWQQWVFPCILYLQKLSNHLALLIPSAFDEPDKQSKDADLLSVAMPDDWTMLCEHKDSIMNYAEPKYCGKWKVLKKLLKFWHENGNNKVLVFSHSVRLLKMLQQLFVHTNWNVTYLDGSMKYEERYECVRSFNTDPNAFVFLISTRAGGVGLNITSANKVVVVDPNWNPSHDLQAQDRAYRIGQTRDVEVFRLVSQGTVEEVVYARQIYKQQQANISLTGTNERRYFEGVQGNKSRKGEIFGLENLFAEHNEQMVLREIVNKTNVAEAKAGLMVADMATEEVEEESTSDISEDESKSQDTQGDKADKTLSYLAKVITGQPQKERAKRHDPIQAILASAGVSYTHENSEVIGESKVEAALSKRAADNTESQNKARVFAETQSQGKKQQHPATAAAAAAVAPAHEDIRYRYRPPEDVKRRQFAAMARWAGYGDVVEFALVIESYTQSERRDFLDSWYAWRRTQRQLIPHSASDGADPVNDETPKQVEARTPFSDPDPVRTELKKHPRSYSITEDNRSIKFEGMSTQSKANTTISNPSKSAMVEISDDENEDEDDEL